MPGSSFQQQLSDAAAGDVFTVVRSEMQLQVFTVATWLVDSCGLNFGYSSHLSGPQPLLGAPRVDPDASPSRPPTSHIPIKLRPPVGDPLPVWAPGCAPDPSRKLFL
eukprot:766428-Hanusia_phi.AAC.15